MTHDGAVFVFHFALALGLAVFVLSFALPEPAAARVLRVFAAIMFAVAAVFALPGIV